MDTTPPDFTGAISLSLSGDFLVASWSANGFSDNEELFDLEYQFAIGMHIYKQANIGTYNVIKDIMFYEYLNHVKTHNENVIGIKGKK